MHGTFRQTETGCYSSGVEHSLGKGEAESSNLSSSTSFFFIILFHARLAVTAAFAYCSGGFDVFFASSAFFA